MQVLNPTLDLSRFLDHVARAPSRVLLLDYDGTLAPFRVDPARAVPYPEVVPVLQRIVRSGRTRVVVVSGRPAAELPPLLRLDPRPEIWGGHGWERLEPDGTLRLERPGEAARLALDRAAAAADDIIARGARIERKTASIAAHWRGVPDEAASACREAARRAWSPMLRAGGLQLLPFDGGLELRVPGRTKRNAVEAVLGETPPDAAVAYLGDDITDEDAFRAVKPRGLAVLVRAELRATDADVWLRPPNELLEFLDRWCV